MEGAAGFKSPRPPAPRRSRSRSQSLAAATASQPINGRSASTSSRSQNTGNGQDDGDGHGEQLTANGLLARLEGLLVAKSNEIVLAGRLGESLLTQQAELEARIRELEDELQLQQQNDAAVQDNKRRNHTTYNTGIDSSDDDVDGARAIVAQETRDKLRALESELKRWERGNEEIYKAVGMSSAGTAGNDMSRQASQASATGRPITPPPPLPTSSSYVPPPLPSDATPASPSANRRQRNAQHRANDIEFATEIGQSLLIEVRRLQALLSERDAQLAASRAEKDGMERSMESLASGLKSVEESLDKYREENWNLEVQNQEVRTQLTDLSGNFSKVESERARLVKELSSARETLDNQKLDNERLGNQLETMKNKHETDMANMRRTNAGLQREKSDIQAAFDTARNELATKGRGIKRSGSAASTSTMILSESGHGPAEGSDVTGGDLDEDEEDVFGTTRRGWLGNRRKTGDYLDSPGGPGSEFEDGSSLVRGAPEMNETDKLRGNLSHAQKTIQTLRAALIREKEARMALKQKVKGGEAAVSEDEELEDDEDDALTREDDEVNENDPSQARRQGAATRRGRGGRGRGVIVPRRGSALIGRLPRGVQPSRLSTEVSADDVDFTAGSDQADLSVNSEQEELASFREGEGEDDDERDALRASRSSLAAMDPAFADILPRSSSTQTARGGTLGSVRDNRPSSMMFAGDLDILEKLRKQEEENAELRNKPVVDTKEIAIMTDELPPPPAPEPIVQYVEVQVPAPKPESKESSCQTGDIPPPPAPEPVIQYVEVQPPKPPSKESAIQTDEVPPPPVPEPVIQYVEVEVAAAKPASTDSGIQTDDLPPVPVPEPIVKYIEVPAPIPEPVVQYVEVQAPRAASVEHASQTDDVPPPPVPEPRIVHVEVPVPATKPESREFSSQTDEIAPPPAPEPVYVQVPVEVQVPAPKPESREVGHQTESELVVEKKEFALQTDAEPIVEKRDMASMAVPEAVHRLHASMMTEVPQVEQRSMQTEALPIAKDDDADTTANLSAMHFTSADEEAMTPTLESTPTFPERTSYTQAHRPNYSIGNRSITQDSSVAPSFKSFRDTDYDTATETEGDFEDARETLNTFDRQSPSMTHLSNASHSTILRSSGRDSDQESEYGGSALATPRYPKASYRRSAKMPVATRETGTSPTGESEQLKQAEEPAVVPSKPETAEIGVQTDAVPDPPATSPTSAVFSDGGSSAADLDRRYSAATFGGSTDQRRDSGEAAIPAALAPAGLVYLERAGISTPLASSASMASRRSSTHTSASIGGDSFVPPPMPVSPSQTRAPKLSIPPPPAGAPPKDVLRNSTTPSFRPPRPSSPPPPELLQRAQTPTFLAPGSVSRKRTSASESSAGATGNGMGNMLVSRNEQQYGASPAPFPHNRPPPSQPRAVASAAQLRNAPPIRYQAASTEPTAEFGTRSQGASTPVHQMQRPASRATSTRKKGTVSRASMSSMGSAHSRHHSIASSRTSDAGDDLPDLARTPGNKSRHASSNGTPGNSTDPAILHNITQTMIGDYLFKYTRNSLTGNLSEKRHQRFFWIHPYTKTLYWGTLDPGSVKVNESKAKSVFIAGVRVESDSNPNPPGLYQKSIVVHTGQREIKLTAASKEKHEMWLSAINYLLARPDGTPPTPVAAGGPGTPSSTRFSLGRSITRSASSMRFRQRSDPMSLAEVGYNMARSTNEGSQQANESTVVPKSRTGTSGRNSSAGMYLQDSQSEPRLTPKPSKGRRSTGAPTSMMMQKRSDTPAAEYQNYINEFGSPRSVRTYARPATSMSTYNSNNPDDSLEVIDRREALGAGSGANGETGYEGLENVRACCDGAHDVGKLSVSKKHHHHNHNHRHQHQYDTASRASRTNTVTSRASSKRTTFSTMTTEHPPPLPSSRMEEPGSPSLRASTMLRGRNNSSNSGASAISAQNVFRSSSPLPGATATATIKGKARA